MGVPVVGVDGATWSDVLVMPEFARIVDPAIWLAAITIAIVASLETLLNLDATDRLDPQKRHSPPNRELVAQGVGNTLSGMIGGLPMTSVIVRSSVNAQSGATTRLSAITHGVLLGQALLPELLNRIPFRPCCHFDCYRFQIGKPRSFVLCGSKAFPNLFRS